MSKPTVVKEGSSIILTWAPEGIKATVATIREDRGEIKAEVTFYGEVPDGGWGHLLTRRMSLLTDGERYRISQRLIEKMDRVNWAEILEQTCVHSVRSFREGSPIVRLRDVQTTAALPYLIDRIVPELSTSIVFGDGEAGKSMFALFVAIAYAAGRELPSGLRPNGSGNVLYLDWEADPDEHKRRMTRISEGMGIPEPQGIYYRPCTRPIHEEADALAVQVIQLDIGLVIVDSLAPACGGDPSLAADAVRTMNALRQLGATRLAIGHVNRVDREKPAANQTTFGSIFWRNLTRSMWQLIASDEGGGDEARFALYQRKSNNAKRERWPIGLRYEFDGDSGPIRISADAIDALDGLAAGASITERLRRALTDGAKSLEELGDIVDREPGQVRSALTKMRDVVNLNAGQTGRNHKGAYGLKAYGEDPQSPPAGKRCFKCGEPWSEKYDDKEGRPCCDRHQEAN